MKNELWLIWKQTESRTRYKIGLLEYKNNEYIFNYINPELNVAIADGFDYFPGFPDIFKEYRNIELFANIATRLPNTKREDYLDILNRYGLNKNSSQFEILKATKGRLLTDNYEFVPVFNKNKIEFDLAGVRYRDDIEKCKDYIKINTKLELELEENKKYIDGFLIKVNFNFKNNKYHIGNVPRYYIKEIKEQLRNNKEYSLLVKSINFESPFYDEKIIVKLIF